MILSSLDKEHPTKSHDANDGAKTVYHLANNDPLIVVNFKFIRKPGDEYTILCISGYTSYPLVSLLNFDAHGPVQRMVHIHVSSF